MTTVFVKKPYNLVRRVPVTKILKEFPFNGTQLELAHRLMKPKFGANLTWVEAKSVIDWYAQV
jgi:hypothetical protein